MHKEGDRMAGEALLQVPMDADVKMAAEEFFRSRGTSLAEAVRVFALESIAMKDVPSRMKKRTRSSAGMLAKYANPDLIPMEKAAWAEAAEVKYGKKVH